MTDIIGIDPGTQTGVAIIHDGRLVELETYNRLNVILGLSGEWELNPENTLVCIEDTRNLPIYADKRGKGGNSIHAERGHGWEANPWVWVVEFKLIEVAK